MNLPQEVHGVNIEFINTSTPAASRPYHHGDLRNALVDAGVELAREGGPTAIVLREAARRVGVSPNAAYRHFADLPDLVHAVAGRALEELADTMRRELALCQPTADPQHDAWARMCATGRGYIHFALEQPGLFAGAFDHDGKETSPLPQPDPNHDIGVGAADLLTQGLEGLIATGLLAAEDMESAATLAWSAVHGLSWLLLGPLRGLPAAEQEAVIEAMLIQIGRGLITPPR